MKPLLSPMLILSSLVGGVLPARAADPVPIPDKNLEAAIRDTLHEPKAPLTDEKLANVYDLEAAAKAIHSKAVRESETSANPSTLGAEIEGQISPTNAESGLSQTEIPTP